MPHVNMPWRRTVTELIDSEDESWLNQPKFKLSESDSDSGDFDSGVGVAYVEAVAALKKVKHVAAPNRNESSVDSVTQSRAAQQVTLSNCEVNLSPRHGLLSSQVCSLLSQFSSV